MNHVSNPVSDDDHLVTVSSLANMIRLLAAELVAGRHRDSVVILEQAMRAKIGNVPHDAFTDEAYDKGLTTARMLVEQVLVQVRAQAKAASDTTGAQPAVLPTPSKPRSPRKPVAAEPTRH